MAGINSGFYSTDMRGSLRPGTAAYVAKWGGNSLAAVHPGMGSDSIEWHGEIRLYVCRVCGSTNHTGEPIPAGHWDDPIPTHEQMRDAITAALSFGQDCRRCGELRSYAVAVNGNPAFTGSNSVTLAEARAMAGVYQNIPGNATARIEILNLRVAAHVAHGGQ